MTWEKGWNSFDFHQELHHNSTVKSNLFKRSNRNNFGFKENELDENLSDLKLNIDILRDNFRILSYNIFGLSNK